jgi:hypothetical protein
MADEFMKACLQAHWRSAWGISETFLASCGSACNDQADGGGIVNVVAYLGEAMPEATMGFVSYTGDATMRQFYGYGREDCDQLFALVPPEFPPELYAQGLVDLRDEFASAPQWGSYFIDGTSHIALLGPEFYSTEVGGVRLRDWFAAMISGEPSHVAP